MADQKTQDDVGAASDAASWDKLNAVPSVSRFGWIGIALARIENKLDARAIIDFAMAAAALAAGIAWLFSLGREALLAALQCSNLRVATNHAAIFVIVLLSVLIVVDLLRRFRDRRRLLLADRHKEFKILQRVSLVHVNDSRHIDYYYRFIVRATRKGIKSFSMRYEWTGKVEEFKIYLKNPRFSLVTDNHSDWSGREIIINFNKVLDRREEEVIEFCFRTVAEIGKEAAPFSSLSIGSAKFPKLNTFIIVSFSETVRVAALYRRKYFSALADQAISSKIVNLKGDRVHPWRIPVRVGWKYALRWDYGV